MRQIASSHPCSRRTAWFVVALVALFPVLVRANPMDLDVFSSFEPGQGIGINFTVGESPLRATFTGGEATILNIPALYHSGGFSWIVENGAVVMIDFETPASIVEFFAIDQSAANGGVISAFSPTDELLDSIPLTTMFSSPMNDFSNPLSFSGLGPIGRIELTNTLGLSVFDDFGFSGFVETFPWQNLADPFNVNDDAFVNVTDVLDLVRDLRSNKFRLLEAPTPGNSPPPFVDVRADNFANLTDLLALVQEVRMRMASSAEGENTAAIAAVPEPSSIALLLTGSLLLLLPRMWRRRFRRR